MTLEQSDMIQGKVAEVLTNRELLINRGSEDGVEIGMRFAVLNRRGVDVKDPDTGEPLGSAKVVKTVVKVVRIEGAHLSAARTFRTITGTPGLGSLLSATAYLAGTPDRTETLSIHGSGAKAELDPEESYVKIGDPVVQTIGDEYDDL